MNKPTLIDPKIIQARQAEQEKEDVLGRRAASEPLPGPLRDVFALVSEITVGPYQVRPFFDVDFEFLTALEHPLKDLMTSQDAAKGLLPTGKDAWALCWIMTHSTEEVDDTFQKGVGEVRRLARKEFGFQQVGRLQAITEAIVRQMTIYWSPVLEYGVSDAGDENGQNPTNRSLLPRMASGGSWIKE